MKNPASKLPNCNCCGRLTRKKLNLAAPPCATLIPYVYSVQKLTILRSRVPPAPMVPSLAAPGSLGSSRTASIAPCSRPAAADVAAGAAAGATTKRNAGRSQTSKPRLQSVVLVRNLLQPQSAFRRSVQYASQSTRKSTKCQRGRRKNHLNDVFQATRVLLGVANPRHHRKELPCPSEESR